MKEQIIRKLGDIEQRYGVRILLAVESGSRAWGFASPDSDYDVRFIYVHLRDWYLSLQERRDVIEELDPERILDVSGWDLRKALTLMARCNCAFVEWLSSPIIYYSDEAFSREILDLKDKYFRKVSSVNHYFHMAMNHDKKYLEKRGCELKRFMYHIRGLLAARWAMEKGTYPPIPFMRLADAEISDETVKAKLTELVRLKSTSKEHDRAIVDEVLIQYAAGTTEEIQNRLGSFPAEPQPDYSPLDRFFLKVKDKEQCTKYPSTIRPSRSGRKRSIRMHGRRS